MARRYKESNEVEPKVLLSGMLAEFRTALEQEIEAAKRNVANSATALLDGKRVAQIAGSYQYVFSIESPINVPADTPGDLIIPGRDASLPVTVITVADLKITVGVGVNLGSSIPYARLQSDLTMLLRRLIDRIEKKAGETNAAGDRILGKANITGDAHTVELPEGYLNQQQKDAVFSCLGRNATFIWGPPGTGKTKTIGAIGEQLFRSTRSLLLVSHTNTAVDEALLRIADALGSDFKDGEIVRVGDPALERLRQRPQYLLKPLAEKKAVKLNAQKERLKNEREQINSELSKLEWKIAVCEWANEGEPGIAVMNAELLDIHRLDSQALRTQDKARQAADDREKWEMAGQAAQKTLNQQSELQKTLQELDEHEKHDKQKQRTLTIARERLSAERERLARSEEAAPLRERLRRLPTRAVQTAEVNWICVETTAAQCQHAEVKSQLDAEQAVFEATSSVGTIKRLLRKLPRPEFQASVVESWKASLAQGAERLAALEETQASSEAVLSEIENLEARLQSYADIPEAHHQSLVVKQLESEISALELDLQKLAALVETLFQRKVSLRFQIEVFDKAFSAPAAQVLGDAESFFQRLAELKQALQRINRERLGKRAALEIRLRDSLDVLRQYSLASDEAGSAESMLNAIKSAYLKAKEETSGSSLTELRIERDSFCKRLVHISVELEQIEEALKKVEEQIINDARIVATTLTRTYLWDSIQGRRFDTVILDEASMAPIPALWIAASLSSSNVVVVGDFRQLPPIVQSDKMEAERWLGRDIFEACGIRKACESHKAPSHFVPLSVQFRMHPLISRVPNKLFYDHKLQDSEFVKSKDRENTLRTWYAADWGYDAPVLLVSTETAGAWVTTKDNSRLNFLSATICVDLAELFLSKSRPPWKDGEPRRIIIVSPYRPHANLVNRLLRAHPDEQIREDVVAGTAHNFQGGEADLVILDLVVDEPQWRTNMTNPQAD